MKTKISFRKKTQKKILHKKWSIKFINICYLHTLLNDTSSTSEESTITAAQKCQLAFLLELTQNNVMDSDLSLCWITKISKANLIQGHSHWQIFSVEPETWLKILQVYGFMMEEVTHWQSKLCFFSIISLNMHGQ